MRTVGKSCLGFLSLAIVFAANAFGQERTYKIDLSGKEEAATVLNLSSIAADINYIALETTPACFITKIWKLIKTKENLLVLDRTGMQCERLMVFNLDGSFKALIQSVGKGPGEYVEIDDFAFDPQNQNITILDSNQKKLLQFSLSGKFIREARMDVRPYDMCYVEPGYFVVAIPLRTVQAAADGKLYNIVIYDRDLKFKKQIPASNESLESPDTPFLMTGGLSSYKDRLRYKQPFVNDIYTLDKNLEYRVFCSLILGKYKAPESVASSTRNYRSRIENYKEFHSLIESENFLFLKYQFAGKLFANLYNKSTGKIANLTGKDDEIGLTNDFDGTMSFWPKLSAGSNQLIRALSAIEMLEYCEKNHVRKFKSKFPIQQRRLIDLLNKLTQESNPVIQVVTLK